MVRTEDIRRTVDTYLLCGKVNDDSCDVVTEQKERIFPTNPLGKKFGQKQCPGIKIYRPLHVQTHLHDPKAGALVLDRPLCVQERIEVRLVYPQG